MKNLERKVEKADRDLCNCSYTQCKSYGEYMYCYFDNHNCPSYLAHLRESSKKYFTTG